MQVQVSKKLLAAFSEQKKNPNYALSFVLNSMDPDSCTEGLKLVDVFSFNSETEAINIDAKNVKLIQLTYDEVDTAIVERLLWIALLFPEI